MNLGGNSDSSKDAFVTAMRERLETLDDEDIRNAAIDAIDEEEGEVQKNLGALGKAVYVILTEKAETISAAPSEAINGNIWTWIQETNDWMTDLYEWQQRVQGAFDSWSPTSSEGQALKMAITQLDDLGEPPINIPTEIRGKIQ